MAAPLAARAGAEFIVSVGVPPGTAAVSARLDLAYDPAQLEPIGAAVSAPGRIPLKVDGTASVRFKVLVPQGRVQVRAENLVGVDPAGTTLPMLAPAPVDIMIRLRDRRARQRALENRCRAPLGCCPQLAPIARGSRRSLSVERVHADRARDLVALSLRSLATGLLPLTRLANQRSRAGAARRAATSAPASMPTSRRPTRDEWSARPTKNRLSALSPSPR
jgi:hypothetical protein